MDNKKNDVFFETFGLRNELALRAYHYAAAVKYKLILGADEILVAYKCTCALSETGDSRLARGEFAGIKRRSGNVDCDVGFVVNHPLFNLASLNPNVLADGHSDSGCASLNDQVL